MFIITISHKLRRENGRPARISNLNLGNIGCDASFLVSLEWDENIQEDI